LVADKKIPFDDLKHLLIAAVLFLCSSWASCFHCQHHQWQQQHSTIIIMVMFFYCNRFNLFYT